MEPEIVFNEQAFKPFDTETNQVSINFININQVTNIFYFNN